QRPLVLGVDTRNRDFSAAQLLETIEQIGQHPKLQLQTLFLECTVDALLRRYSETRRKHHLSPSESALHGIERDLELMTPLKALADVLINTSDLSPRQLQSEVMDWFAPKSGAKMAISVQSFSYKRGTPRSVDMMFDCRFLRNPYWDVDLRSSSGLDPAVQEYVKADERFDAFQAQVLKLIELVIPAHVEEGRSHLTIAFGCTGGQHRSVTMAQVVQDVLQTKDWHVTIRHRELDSQYPHKAAHVTKVM
ncbi:MAG: RNase adapter RapZ, partial [Planktomarina sp.]